MSLDIFSGNSLPLSSKIKFTALIGRSPELLDKTSLILPFRIFPFSPGIFLILSCALSKNLTVKSVGKKWKIFEKVAKYLKNIWKYWKIFEDYLKFCKIFDFAGKVPKYLKKYFIFFQIFFRPLLMTE